MSAKPRAPDSRSPAPPRVQLSAHTERANALTEKVFYGKISQKDYDAQTYSTTIVSMDRATSVPIVLTIDESLATVKAYALRKFKIPLAKAETIKMYVLWSTKVFNAVGVHLVPENLVLLDQDTLNMILTFMKASPQVEQLFVQFDEDMAEVAVEFGNITVETNKTEAEVEDDAQVQEGEHSTLLNVKELGSSKGKEPSASPYAKNESNSKGKEPTNSRKGKERESPKGDGNAGDSVKGHQRDPSHLSKESEQRASIAKQQSTPKEVRVKSESRTSGSTSGTSKGSSRGEVKEEKRGNRRGGR